MPFPSRQHGNRGVTLVEMLVVISIMVLLMAVAIPALQPFLEGRPVRDAARLVRSYIDAARIRAMETGRPCGVVIHRDPALPNAGATICQIEVPPSYSGDVSGACVKVCDVTKWDSTHWYWSYYRAPDDPYVSAPPDVGGHVVLKVKVRPNDFFGCVRLVRHGDRMQLNHSGHWFVIVDDPYDQLVGGVGHDFPVDSRGFINFDPSEMQDSDGDTWADDTEAWLTLVLDRITTEDAAYPTYGTGGTVTNLQWSTDAYPFEIRRQPTQTSAPPLELRQGVAVDLSCSGTELQERLFGSTNPYPVMILFSPNGQLDRLYVDNTEYAATEPVYLMVGRRERMSSVTLPDDGLANWQDLSNRWLAINPKTGTVTTAPPYADPTNIDPATQTSRPLDLAQESRYSVQRFQLNLGGR